MAELSVEMKDQRARIWAESEHEEVFWKRFSSGTWEPQTFQVLDQYIRPAHVYLDVGSWIGPTALYAAALGARVYSYEPDPVAYRRLDRNVKLNPELAARIRLHPYGLGPTSQKTTLYAVDEFGNSGSSMERFSAATISTEVEIRDIVKDLSVLDSESICLVKMDIEGGEYRTLPKITPLLKRKKIPLYLSFHPSKLPPKKTSVATTLDRIFHSVQLRWCLRYYTRIRYWDGQRWAPISSFGTRGKRAFARRQVFFLRELMFDFR